jgi:hypothetical protein
MTTSKSCVGCMYLFLEDDGYSNYTVTDTLVHCARALNPNLIYRDMQRPSDWAVPHIGKRM